MPMLSSISGRWRERVASKRILVIDDASLVRLYYRDALERHGMVLSGVSPDGRLVEMLELPQHPYFVACQFHPEFKSRPSSPHPLFSRFIKASVEQQAHRK